MGKSKPQKAAIDYDDEELEKLTDFWIDNGQVPLTDGFDCENVEEIASIKRLSMFGYIDVFFADDTVGAINYVTKEGMEHLRTLATRTKGDKVWKTAGRLAGIAGHFAGGFFDENNGM